MKIIHILKGKANPNTMNGVNKVVHHLATEQKLLGHDVEVWGITATPNRVKHNHTYSLRLFHASRSRFLLSSLLKKALNSLSSVNTIVHLHSVFLPELFAVSHKLKKNKVRWVLSPHSGYNPNSMKKNNVAKNIYMQCFDKHVITGAVKIHAIGDGEVAEIRALDSSADIVLLPNGQAFEDVVFTPIVRNEPNERPVFGYCGRLARDHKGLDLLIQGFAKYKKSGAKGELWLIGDGPDRALLNRLAEKEGVADSICFLGTMFGDEKLSTIKQMNIFVHTSRWEGMPTATLEASAIGKPLLISEETNMGNYVRKHQSGLVLDSNTPKVIAAAMSEFKQLFDGGLDIAMGDNSIKLVKEELSWPLIAKSMVETLYQQGDTK